MIKNLISKIVHWLDPKLDRYRTKSTPAEPPKYTPTSLADFIEIIKRTPKSILSNQDRNRIAAIMNFETRHVSDLMIGKDQMVYVDDQEILGPLTLDKLYQSGFTNFPVIDDKGQVLGILHTEALNTLAIKKTDRAHKYINKNVNYLHTTDSLQFAIEEIERTNGYYFLVRDSEEHLVGFFTIQNLLDYLLK